MKNKGLSIKDSLSLKGIAIIMLLFYHLFRVKKLYKNYDVNFFPFPEEFAIDTIVMCKICVSIFAFITGYGLLKSIKNTKFTRSDVTKWNITRILKTMSGFYFVYIIAFITTMALNKLPIKVYFKKGLVNGIFNIIIDFLGLSNLMSTPTLLSSWWYMSAAIIFIMLIPVFYGISKKIGYLPIIMIIVAIPRLLLTGYPGGLNTYSFLIPLIMGMIFADYYIFEKISDIIYKNKINYASSLLLMTVLSGSCFIFFRNINHTQHWEIKWGLVPVILICFFRYYIIRIPGISHALTFIGKYSMLMYLVHNFLPRIYIKDFLYSYDNYILIWFVLFVISLVLAIILNLLMKFCRFEKFVDKMKNRLLKLVDKIQTESKKVSSQ